MERKRKNPVSKRPDKFSDRAWLREEVRSSMWNFLGMPKHKSLMCLKILTCKKAYCAETTAVGTPSSAIYTDAQMLVATNVGYFRSRQTQCAFWVVRVPFALPNWMGTSNRYLLTLSPSHLPSKNFRLELRP